jgi:hypothetical protein
MPAAAIIVGLVSGLVGGLLGALLTISHERAAEFRSRMFVAAEDFLRRAQEVRRRARHPPAGLPPAQALELLLTAWDQLVSALILIELLYGKDSEAAHWAREATTELSDVEETLRTAIEASPDSRAAIEEHMQTAGGALEKFAEAAAAQVRRRRN